MRLKQLQFQPHIIAFFTSQGQIWRIDVHYSISILSFQARALGKRKISFSPPRRARAQVGDTTARRESNENVPHEAMDQSGGCLDDAGDLDGLKQYIMRRFSAKICRCSCSQQEEELGPRHATAHVAM